MEILTVTALLLFSYIVAGTVIYLRQDSFIYRPCREIFRFPSDAGMEFEDIDIITPDGETLNAWYIPASGKNKGKTVLFCHGNAGSLSHRIDTIAFMHDLGLSVFIFDYRGYGISTGAPGESGTGIDAEAAYNYILEHIEDEERNIIIWGRSLGGPVAAKLAAGHRASACILESTFTSISDMAGLRFRIFPGKLLCRYRYPTIEYVKNIKMPLLIVHSPEDEIIPYRMGKELFSAAAEPKGFLEIRGSHNNCYFESEPEYRAGLLKILSLHHAG